MQLRPATPRDDAAVLAIAQRIYERTGSYPASRWITDGRVRADWLGRSTPVLSAAVVEDAGRVMGLARVVELDERGMVGPDYYEVERLVVDPDRWGEGVATTLLGWARDEASARRGRVALVVMRANVEARRVYERLGWRYVHEFAGHEGVNLVMVAS